MPLPLLPLPEPSDPSARKHLAGLGNGNVPRPSLKRVNRSAAAPGAVPCALFSSGRGSKRDVMSLSVGMATSQGEQR